jgi:hypothetical protein
LKNDQLQQFLKNTVPKTAFGKMIYTGNEFECFYFIFQKMEIQVFIWQMTSPSHVDTILLSSLLDNGSNGSVVIDQVLKNVSSSTQVKILFHGFRDQVKDPIRSDPIRSDPPLVNITLC